MIAGQRIRDALVRVDTAGIERLAACAKLNHD
jgi:hypothetical protein